MANKNDTRTMFLSDSPWKLLLKLSVPAIIGMVVVGLYNLMDAVFVGQMVDLLLIDERKGRNVAKQRKVKYIGTAGILMLAYDLGLMEQAEIKNCMNAMLESQIRLDTKICNLILKHAGIDVS